MKTEKDIEEEIEKWRFGCGKELGEDYCGKDIWICNECAIKLNQVQAKLQGYKLAEKEFVEKVEELNNEADKLSKWIHQLETQKSDI